METQVAQPNNELSRQELENWLRNYLAQLSGVPASRVGLEDDFEQYGLDSAQAVELTIALEDEAQLSVDIPPETIFEHRTILALLDFLDALRAKAEP